MRPAGIDGKWAGGVMIPVRFAPITGIAVTLPYHRTTFTHTLVANAIPRV
jgi:hypothetical protein